MLRTALVVLPLVISFAPALAQQAPHAGVVRAYMEGCLQTSQSQGPEAAQDFCTCTAKLMLPGPGASSGDPMDSMMQCMPGMPRVPGDD